MYDELYGEDAAEMELAVEPKDDRLELMIDDCVELCGADELDDEMSEEWYELTVLLEDEVAD